jgi:predicted alpha/beta hydrolase family esterase
MRRRQPTASARDADPRPRKNVLECLLARRELSDLPLVFVCHSLGGLVVKQVLRAADRRRVYGTAEARALLDSVKGIVFIATSASLDLCSFKPGNA